MASETRRLNGRETVTFALLGAVMFVLKMVMAGLPNIEPVSLLLIAYTLVFGRKALWPLYTYVVLEFLVWGVGMWNINYLYVWTVLFFAARIFRRMESPLGWGVLAGAFGLLFGVLCAPVYWVTGGWGAAVSWWVSGIPFDLLHCVGNFVATWLLLRPCCEILQRMKTLFLK